jgi:hypothetical protein
MVTGTAIQADEVTATVVTVAIAIAVMATATEQVVEVVEATVVTIMVKQVMRLPQLLLTRLQPIPILK